MRVMRCTIGDRRYEPDILVFGVGGGEVTDCCPCSASVTRAGDDDQQQAGEVRGSGVDRPQF